MHSFRVWLSACGSGSSNIARGNVQPGVRASERDVVDGNERQKWTQRLLVNGHLGEYVVGVSLYDGMREIGCRRDDAGDVAFDEEPLHIGG